MRYHFINPLQRGAMMKKWVLLLLLIFLSIPLVIQAEEPGSAEEPTGTISGQLVNEADEVLTGGVVSFFYASEGVPMVGKTHRIPDMVGRMDRNGKFSINLQPGTYYLGALIITDPGRGPGPPREGEKFYFVRDDKNNLFQLSVKANEVKDLGKLTGALPEAFLAAINMITVTGRLLVEGDKPFAGGIVLAKTDMKSQRPDFISERTGEDGRYVIKLPADTAYYLVSRQRVIGRPTPGSYVGTYGSNSAINAGGALPIGNVRPPSQPASGMPQQSRPQAAPAIQPGKEVPIPVQGNPDQTISGIDILMFKVPDPNQQREQLQGTLGFEGPEQEGEAGAAKPAAAPPEKKK